MCSHEWVHDLVVHGLGLIPHDMLRFLFGWDRRVGMTPAHVRHKGVPLREAPPTYVARVHDSLVNRVLVVVQPHLAGVRLAADVTGNARSLVNLPYVRLHVLLQAEALPADGTLERTLFQMNAVDVVLEGTLGAELLAAG